MFVENARPLLRPPPIQQKKSVLVSLPLPWSSHSKSAADLADIENLETDFSDGTRLCALVEVLQKRKLKHNKRPLNQHHELENISIALDAIQEDGIKLVNIGKQ